MLMESLYKIIATEEKGQNIVSATLELNAFNEIFNGHFPNQPVLPGACMVQMVKEILEATINKPVRLQKADNLKFLSLVDPTQNNQLRVELNYAIAEAQIKVTASLMAETIVCFKFQGVFIQL